MKHIVIERFLPSIHGTFGYMQLDNFVFFTLEEEWKNNEANESCIPADTYEIHRVKYNKGGFMTYEVMDVPGRSYIKFHPGNTEEDTQGCILLGMKLGVFTVPTDEETGLRAKKLAVLKSRVAFQRFMSHMGGVNKATLEITWS